MQTISYADALFTKTQQRVLGLLYGKPDKRFFTNEIMRAVDMGRGTVTRELDRLTSASILVSYREGNQRYFQANGENPIFDELLNIVRKTFGIVDVIKTALISKIPKIDYAFIYGSVAKKTEHKNSDIDVMIIGSLLEYSDVMGLLMQAEEIINRKINPTIYTLNDFKERLLSGNSFITRVMEQEKLILKGNVEELI